jgi:hypothetical protein
MPDISKILFGLIVGVGVSWSAFNSKAIIDLSADYAHYKGATEQKLDNLQESMTLLLKHELSVKDDR